MPTAEGAAFAARTGCLFVEASAKTAVGVVEAFSDVVARIIDTPSLWREEKQHDKGSPRVAAGNITANATAGGPRVIGSMPGTIDLSQVHDDETSGGGCLC